MSDASLVADAAPQSNSAVVPVLVLRDPAAAAAFYGLAFGAEVRSDGECGAELLLGATTLRLVRADRQRGLLGADSFGGAPVLFALTVAELDAAVARAVAHGAVILHAPAASTGGRRSVLLRDPFLHVWEIAEADG